MVNFQRLLRRIKRKTGWSDQRISDITGIPRTTIMSLRTGQNIEPHYHCGAALVKLDEELKALP